MPSHTLNKNRYIFVSMVGMMLAFVAIFIPMILDRSLWKGVPIQFADLAGEQLVGSYYPGEIEAGVLLLEGFGSDQVNLRSAASEFSQAGYHVFTFDFSGHGRSPGTLGYDNAETPRLAHQVLAAIDQFQVLSGLQNDRIILLGHSLGARVALQAATMDSSMAGLILLGTQVNLSTNTQAEFFTGVSDSDLEWVQNLGPKNPATSILMISGEWDDILTPEAAQLLANKLSGQILSRSGGSESRVFPNGKQHEFVILPRLLHNYEIFSPRALATSIVWASQKLGEIPQHLATSATIRISCWVLGFTGLFISLIGIAGWKKSGNEEIPSANIQIIHLKRFMTAKLFLWLGALPLGALIVSVFFFLPIGLPTFNLIYVAFFGGYGVLMWLLYHFGRMPGTQGRLSFVNSAAVDKSGVFSAIVATILMLVVTSAYARTGWFYVYPMNMRLFWLVLFSLPTALGFWIGIYEIGMIDRFSPKNVGLQGVALLIGILPFFLYTAFLASIGSLSGVIGGMQGLLILGLVLTFGYLLRQLTRVYWLVALSQALLLYWLILPQGVLFG